MHTHSAARSTSLDRPAASHSDTARWNAHLAFWLGQEIRVGDQVAHAVGVVFVATIGWRLIPTARREHDSSKELFDLEGYIAEVKVAEKSSIIGKKVGELDDTAEEHEVEIVGLVRRGQRMPGLARLVEIRPADILVV